MINSKISLLTFCVIGASCGSSSLYADIYDGTPQKLIATHSNKCMDIRPPKTTSDSAIVQMSCSSDIFQKWKAISLGNNEFQIVSAGSGMCLDVSGASKMNGGLIKQSGCVTGRANQTWYIKQIYPDTYQIVSKNSAKCIDVTNASTADNVQLQQWDCGTNGNQLWRAEIGLTPSPPIVINGQSNVTISNVKISNPAGPCILVKGNSKNITIKNSELGPCKTDFAHPMPDLTNVGAGVFVIDSGNVTVNNINVHDTDDAGVTIFYGSDYLVSNSQFTKINSNAVKVQGSANVTIQNNKINTVTSGIYVATTTNVKVLKNNLAHMQGKPHANFIQFNQVNGTGNRIMCNIGLQDAYGTPNTLDSIEDDISLYKSKGTITDPILVVGNKVKNGGPSGTGSGIMLGDNGGTNIIARDNVVVNTGNLGMAMSGGTNIQLVNNKIFSTYFPITHNALAVWNYNMGTVICDNVTATGNQVNWTDAWGPETTIWTNGTCSNTHFSSNTFQDARITAALFDTYTSPECS
ncbi:MAG: RICIN domain-containing protein [Gammaproteobacteria bacterium]|nr:RICIN domain-containing protein [Gammaproteobacteria bacterium]